MRPAFLRIKRHNLTRSAAAGQPVIRWMSLEGISLVQSSRFRDRLAGKYQHDRRIGAQRAGGALLPLQDRGVIKYASLLIAQWFVPRIDAKRVSRELMVP